jgi:hypothetical protein
MKFLNYLKRGRKKVFLSKLPDDENLPKELIIYFKEVKEKFTAHKMEKQEPKLKDNFNFHIDENLQDENFHSNKFINFIKEFENLSNENKQKAIEYFEKIRAENSFLQPNNSSYESFSLETHESILSNYFG